MRRFQFLLATLCLTFLGTWPRSESSAIAEQTPAPVIPESVAGLQAQLEAILSAARSHDTKLEDLIGNLRIPDGTDWFSSTFGENGERAAANYANSWQSYKRQVSLIFQETSKTKLKTVSVRAYSAESMPTPDAFLGAVLNAAKNTTVFYTAVAAKGRGTTALPGVYVYVQGSFRVVNWAAFYGLPKVAPVRIRVGTSVAVNQLIRQVNPSIGEEARQQHLQGRVVLHIIIDRDGTVAQAEPVSGAELLAKAAVEAVRQWRFKPTVLNGDPVEVDTTVEIVFSRNQ